MIVQFLSIALTTLGATQPVAQPQAVQSPPPVQSAQTPLSREERAGQERLQQLEWLAGSWRSAPGRPMFTNEELWTAPMRGSMLGVAREVFDQRTRSYEFMRIAVDRDGSLGFYASPGGAAPSRFSIVSAGPSEFIAENTAHDYPQRIVYRREGDRLVATISLIDGSQANTYTYLRQP
jgi:hypothetical protein